MNLDELDKLFYEATYIAPFHDAIEIAYPSLSDKARAADKLRDALKLLHDNQLEYITINKLGGENNQDMRMARDAIEKYEAIK